MFLTKFGLRRALKAAALGGGSTGDTVTVGDDEEAVEDTGVR